jgi:hypothetical protein
LEPNQSDSTSIASQASTDDSGEHGARSISPQRVPSQPSQVLQGGCRPFRRRLLSSKAGAQLSYAVPGRTFVQYDVLLDAHRKEIQEALLRDVLSECEPT